jgi:hypothetical protein
VDVYEDQHNVTLKMEAPGIDDKGNKDVRIENNLRPTHLFEKKSAPEVDFRHGKPLALTPQTCVLLKSEISAL